MKVLTKSSRHIAKLLGLLVISSIIVMMLAACSNSNSANSTSNSSESTTKHIVGIRVNITAMNWDSDTSTPFILALEPVEEGAVDTTPLYYAVTADGNVDLEVPDGLYQATLISAVNLDGSIYKVPVVKEVTAGTITESTQAFELAPVFESTQLVTGDQMEHVIAATTVASESLQGANGQDVLERVMSNATAAEEVTEDSIQAGETLGREALQNGKGSNVTLNVPPQNLA